MSYQDYLQSAHWLDIKEEALYRADYKCQLCGDYSVQLNVHHNCYDRIGHEKESDLIVLCEDCHADFHNKISNNKKIITKAKDWPDLIEEYLGCLEEGQKYG